MKNNPSPRASAQLAVVHAIRIRGVASRDVICEMTGLDPAVADAELQTTADRGWTVFRENRITSGWGLTPEGRAQHRTALHDDVDASGDRQAIEEAYEGFLAHNQAMKVLCTKWQTEGQPASCVEELTTLHAGIVPVVERLSASVPRFGPYPARLRAALTRFQFGDGTALAKPLSGSYHDVWMELHEDLLLSLDRQRSSDDGQ